MAYGAIYLTSTDTASMSVGYPHLILDDAYVIPQTLGFFFCHHS